MATMYTENTTGAPVKVSREDILEFLKGERQAAESAGDARKKAIYDSVIRYYEFSLQQTRNRKNVRMADGSRKWFMPEEAERLLKLPRKDRI